MWQNNSCSNGTFNYTFNGKELEKKALLLIINPDRAVRSVRGWWGLTAARCLKQKEGQEEATRRRFSPHPAAPGDTEEEKGQRELPDKTENSASFWLSNMRAGDTVHAVFLSGVFHFQQKSSPVAGVMKVSGGQQPDYERKWLRR